MKKKLSREVFLALHESLVNRFKIENPSYSEKSYLLYGYNDYYTQIDTPSLKDAIIKKYKEQGKEEVLFKLFKIKNGDVSYNGKYLWDLRFVRLKEQPEITVNESYLNSWLFYLDIDNLEKFTTQLAKEKALSIQQKLRQDQLLIFTKEKPLELRCSFFSPISDKMENFTLRIFGEQVEVNDAPSGRKYVGKIFNKEYNRRINLISKGEHLSPGYLTIIFKNNDGDWLKSSLTIGYYACFSELDTMAGAIIIEKQFSIEDPIKLIKFDSLTEKVGLNRKREYIFKKMDSEKDSQLVREHLKDLCFFINDKFIREEYKNSASSSQKGTTREKILEKLLIIKKEYFQLYLKSKHLYTSHGDFKYYNEFARYCNEKYKGWSGNQNVLKKISGYYVAYIPRVFKRRSDSEIVKKIEQCLFKFSSNGKIICQSIGAGDFIGAISMKSQRIAQLNMAMDNGESFYQIIFEIPIHQLSYTSTKVPLLKKFKGVYSGVDRRNIPVSNKLYLRELEFKDYVDDKFQPRYFDAVKDSSELEEIMEACPDMKLFFSLNAHDGFSEGGNIFFDNIVSYPINQGQLRKYKGIYEMYRSSNSTSKPGAIKKFPLEIKSNGTVILKYRYQSIYGKALLFGKRLILQFANNGHKKFDSTIMVHLFDAQQLDVFQALMLSANENDEPYSCQVLLLKVKDEDVILDDIHYSKIFINDKRAFGELNNDSFYGFTKIGNKLLDLKSSSHRLMGRNYLFSKEQKNYEGQTINSNEKVLLKNEEVLKITIESLIKFYFVKNKEDRDKMKAMGELLSSLYDNVDEVIKKALEHNDYNLEGEQSKNIFEVWQTFRKKKRIFELDRIN